MATNPLAVNSQWTPQDAPAQVSSAAHNLTEHIPTILKDLEGKSEAQLNALKAEALHEDSNAKQDLYMLRQRIANLGTDVHTNEELLLTAAKRRVAEGVAYLKALEMKLTGQVPVQAEPVVVPEPAPVAAETAPQPVVEEPAPAVEVPVEVPAKEEAPAVA